MSEILIFLILLALAAHLGGWWWIGALAFLVLVLKTPTI